MAYDENRQLLALQVKQQFILTYVMSNTQGKGAAAALSRLAPDLPVKTMKFMTHIPSITIADIPGCKVSTAYAA